MKALLHTFLALFGFSGQAEPLRTLPLESAPVRLRPEDLPRPNGRDPGDNTYKIIPIPERPVLYAPPGFVVEVFADNLKKPRWMELTPSGHLLVTEERGTRIQILEVAKDFSSGRVIGTFADNTNGIEMAMGMGFIGNRFLVANTSGLREFAYTAGQLRLNGGGTALGLRVPMNGYNNHWTRNLVIDRKNDKLYLSVGSGTDREVEAAPRGTIVQMNYQGGESRTFASGLRNPIGMDLHPVTNELYSTCTERDHLGDDLVPDFFTRVKSGGFYGWPYAYLSPNLLDPKHIENGASTRPELVARTIVPPVLFKAHSSPIGFRFARGNNFPSPYRNGGFVALRGSWNHSAGIGFEIAFVAFNENNEPTGTYQTFIKGFKAEDGRHEVWGRPAGIYFLPDGSMLFTDDGNGENGIQEVYGRRIYRVRYQP